MSKTLNKYIRALGYADKTLLALSGGSSVVSLCSFTTAVDTPVTIVSASGISSGIIKIFLKTMGREKIIIERLLYWP